MHIGQKFKSQSRRGRGSCTREARGASGWFERDDDAVPTATTTAVRDRGRILYEKDVVKVSRHRSRRHHGHIHVALEQPYQRISRWARDADASTYLGEDGTGDAEGDGRLGNLFGEFVERRLGGLRLCRSANARGNGRTPVSSGFEKISRSPHRASRRSTFHALDPLARVQRRARSIETFSLAVPLPDITRDRDRRRGAHAPVARSSTAIRSIARVGRVVDDTHRLADLARTANAVFPKTAERAMDAMSISVRATREEVSLASSASRAVSPDNTTDAGSGEIYHVISRTVTA